MRGIETQKLVRRAVISAPSMTFISRSRRTTAFEFLGCNGASKSPTINVLCTMLRPPSGTDAINGYDVAEASC